MKSLELWKFDSYSEFLRTYLRSLPNGGRGFSLKISKAVGVHSTLFSQILRGRRDFTIEQAATFCDYVGFSDDESDLFLLLVELSRAGNESLRKKLGRQIAEIKSRFHEIKSRMKPGPHKLTESERAIFYSTWQYSAVRMLVSLERGLSVEEIAEQLGLKPARIREVVEFLLQSGLLVREKGTLKMGPAVTHIEGRSYWSTRHHLNWRTRHLANVENVAADELCFTAPFSCSKNDFKIIREKFLNLIEEISTLVRESPAEEAHSMCIDLYNL